MEVVHIPLDRVKLGSVRSRRHMEEHRLEELTSSFQQTGILQPIIVRRCGESGYVLIAGERRLQAARNLQYDTIPAVIHSEDRSVRQIQLVENLQREELNPLDRAEAVDHFMKEEGLSKTAAAKRIGIPRTTLNDWLSILDVDEQYQQAVLNNYYGGSSPLTGSHISLARRFSEKMENPALFRVALDAILYYGLTRSETKKILDMVAGRKDISIDEAVRAVRLIPRERGDNRQWEWDVETLVSYLARSGDYLVKTRDDYLDDLSVEQRQELLRQTRALKKLLDEILEKVPGDNDTQVS